MIQKGQTIAKAECMYDFLYHGSEHEDRKGSDTLVVRSALNDSAPWVRRQQRR